jgi:hypothetical protein
MCMQIWTHAWTRLLLKFASYVPFAIQGESKKTDTFDIQMNNKGVSFF